MSTRCLLRELDTLSEAVGNRDMFIGAKLVLRRFQLRHCSHTKACTANQCIQQMIGKRNEHRYIIATQDQDLIESLKHVPGVPILTVAGGRLFLMKPSQATKDAQQKVRHTCLSYFILSANCAL